MLVTISKTPPANEHQWSINSCCSGSVSYPAMNYTTLFLDWVINSQSCQYVSVFHFTNMHAMSHRSDFILACSSGVNIPEPAFYFTITLLLTVSQVKFPSFHIPTAKWDSKSLNTSLREVMISSKYECVFISDFSNHTLQIIFDAWWACLTVGSKCPIAWDKSKHALSLRFNLHCAMEETSSLGIICIVCDRDFAIHQNKGSAQGGNTCWQKRTS